MKYLRSKFEEDDVEINCLPGINTIKCHIYIKNLKKLNMLEISKKYTLPD